MRVRIWCLSCDKEIPVPTDVDFTGGLGDVLGWTNDHLTCPNCSISQYYQNIPIRLGVVEIEEELGKRTDAPAKQFRPQTGTIPSTATF
jgi:hypothetical protein